MLPPSVVSDSVRVAVLYDSVLVAVVFLDFVLVAVFWYDSLIVAVFLLDCMPVAVSLFDSGSALLFWLIQCMLPSSCLIQYFLLSCLTLCSSLAVLLDSVPVFLLDSVLVAVALDSESVLVLLDAVLLLLSYLAEYLY